MNARPPVVELTVKISLPSLSQGAAMYRGRPTDPPTRTFITVFTITALDKSIGTCALHVQVTAMSNAKTILDDFILPSLGRIHTVVRSKHNNNVLP